MKRNVITAIVCLLFAACCPRGRAAEITVAADGSGQFTTVQAAINAAPPGSAGLMRPWRDYGAAAFLNCVMGDGISMRGWAAWNGREKTCRGVHPGVHSGRLEPGAEVGQAQT